MIFLPHNLIICLYYLRLKVFIIESKRTFDRKSDFKTLI